MKLLSDSSCSKGLLRHSRRDEREKDGRWKNCGHIWVVWNEFWRRYVLFLPVLLSKRGAYEEWM